MRTHPAFGCSGLLAFALALVYMGLASAQDQDGATFGFISFATTRVEVHEDSGNFATTVQLPLVREVGTSERVAATVQVINASVEEDFFGSSDVVNFVDGQTTATAVLLLNNDNVPEGNETFIVDITGTLFGAEIGAVSRLVLLVIANDEPFGQFQFSQASRSVTVSESPSGDTLVELTVERAPGTFGRVTVSFQVTSGPNLGLDDLTPTAGQLVFLDTVATQTLSIAVTADNHPEEEETFTVALSNPAGGASLASSGTESTLSVRENDTPIRFVQILYTVEEDAGNVAVSVTRGTLANGTNIGNLDVESTVAYSTSSGTAVATEDYVAQTGTLTFAPGDTTQTITIAIANDTDPEGDETFFISLSNSSADAVLISPSFSTIMIEVSDSAGGLVQFASAGPVTVGEDDGSIARFTVQRLTGTFSDITVEWQIVETSTGNLASDDFETTRGNLTILDGEEEAELLIRPLNDTSPEIAELFSVELVAVVSRAGELHPMGTRVASLIIEDSDDVYGLVELAGEGRLRTTDTTPRQLHIEVTRNEGTTGTILVDYAVTYLPAQTADSAQGDTSVFVAATGSVRLTGGQAVEEFDVDILNEAFLDVDARFRIQLSSAILVEGVVPLVTPTNSPRIGPRSEAFVSVPSAAANGYISFSSSSLSLSTTEPQSAPDTVSLQLRRSGAYGRATVTWRVIPGTAGATDLGTSTGVDTIDNGSNSVELFVVILNDEEPELDETFQVQLVAVAESNQRISTQDSTANVTILLNDNAEGIFSVSSSQTSYTIDESSTDIIFITIRRDEGALTTQPIIYQTIPDTGADFIGGAGITTFQPGQTESTVSVLPNNDVIPEDRETFNFTISLEDMNDTLRLLGSPVSVQIVILPNDDYAGVFRFDDSSLNLTIDEPGTSNSSSTATFSIQRDAGSFTEVMVDWEVIISGSSGDISPTAGSVLFTEGQTAGTFTISALEDEIPESDIHYAVSLLSVSGDARLATFGTESRLTVRHNDDPINLRNDTSVARLSEGDSIEIVVERGGHVNGLAEVSFRLKYVTASADDITVSPSPHLLVLRDGEREAAITVAIADDDIPEEAEMLEIELISTTGDSVLVSPTVATINILPSDDPNGLFQFLSESRNISTEEGNTLQMTVERLQGSFGTVDILINSYLLDTSSGDRTSTVVTDLSLSTSFLTFTQTETVKTFQLTVEDDSIPEFREVFEISLSIDVVNDDSGNGARLDESGSIATVIVAENDDPYGLFLVAAESRELEVAEDVLQNQPELGMGRVIVERTFGTVGNVQVMWDLAPSLNPSLPSFTDLLFFGTRGSGVSVVQSRPHTGTMALQFTGGASSIVTVPVQYHPEIITDQLTISLWLQIAAESSGVLVSKTTNGGSTHFYAFEVSASGMDFLIRFSYLPSSSLSGSSSVEVSVTQGVLADGDWHSLAVVVNSNTAGFYQDGSLINSRTLEAFSISDGEGAVTIGGLPTSNYFTGILQDVRVYRASLTDSQISAIGTDAASSSLTPVSGYLSFPDGVNSSEILIASRDDQTPEPSTVFVLELVNSDGGSRIERTSNAVTITVLKSDAANGVFGFATSSLSNTISEPGTVSLTVQRQEGDYGNVTIHWEILEEQSRAQASSDFSPAFGTLEFSEGIQQVELILQPVDELIPELDETFLVVLVEAISNDGQTSSTPTSGASISTVLAQSNLTVTENDYPYGLLQFSTSLPPAMGIIPPATAPPEVTVRESAGNVTIYAVRAQGNLGTIRAEFITTDSTATSMGVNPDYVSQAGSVEFGPEDREISIVVELVDDSTPELGKEFHVNLTNPAGDRGTPSLGIGSTLTVRILPSDDAFGVFSFGSDSLARVVAETEGGTAVTLTVQRAGGTFDSVSVYWEVQGGEGNGDITPVVGQIDFIEGQTEEQLVLTVSNDMNPELQEVFLVVLLNATGSASVTSTSSRLATITVEASDHPYGLFAFTAAFRPLSVSEGVGEVTVMVVREFGMLGRVSVQYSTVETGHSSLDGLDISRLQQNSELATSGADYTFTSGTLEFADGEVTRSFSLFISDDTLPEVSEYVFIAITSVELDEGSVDTVDTSVLPTAAPGNGSLAFIVIEENDDAHGILELSSSVYDTSEPSQNFVIVNRNAGTFGTVSVQWEASAVTAQQADFAPQRGSVQILAEASSVELPLSIINDNDPEFSETLTVRLVTAGGGARLGNLLTSSVRIEQNDDPNGALQFAAGSRSVQVSEPDGATASSISLTVERTGGPMGVVSVSWSITTDSGDDVLLDIGPVTGTLQFISGVTQQQFNLLVVPDDVPEITETFTVTLFDATGGARIVGSSSAAFVDILPNDSPYGIISFNSSNFVAFEENTESMAIVPVIRSLGTFGDILVIYTTLQQSAEAGSDFTSVIGDEIIIPDGSSLAYIPINITADTLPELNETFQLVLNEVMLGTGIADPDLGGPLLGRITTTDIVIFENDDPYGRFHITGSSGESTVREQEAASVGVSLTVERQGGTIGSVQVTWSVTGGTATEGEDFAGSGAVLTFDSQVSTRVISLILFEDNIPERDEGIVISLSNPTGGAVLASGGGNEVTVVIEANDNAAGIVGLADTARSVIVSEGQTVSLAIERSIGNLGVIEIDWEISGSGNLTEEFVTPSGTATFQDGSSSTVIVFQVASDGNPELEEVYSLSITAVRTVSPDISQLGRAELDNRATMATITVQASDHPHGVVEFQSTSVESEESSPVSLTIVREFGSIGVLNVTFAAVMGNLGKIEPNTTMATSGTDFSTSEVTLQLEDGQTSTTISAPIVNDDDPELFEVFLLSLSSVTLIGIDGGIAPSIGANNQVQITVLPNDNPEGILTFRENRVNVTEDQGELVLTVYRDQGLVGRVAVIAFAVGQGATIGTDFIVENLMELEFSSGVSQQEVSIEIIDDLIPELSEVFCVRLILPEGGAVLGEISEVCVTILTNDDAYGEFRFDANSLSVVIEESGAIPTDANVAELRVIRSGGVIGEVILPYKINVAGSNDLSPVSGVLMFAPNENFKILQLTAVMDDIPELDEFYTVTLLDPDMFGDLSNVNSTAVITILANQNPHGLLEVFPADSNASNIAIEENMPYIELDIIRSYGTFGEITITLNAVEGSAVSPTGDDRSFTTRQYLETVSAEKWHQFSRGGREYLVIVSSSVAGYSVLFEWRGTFVPLQTLDTVGGTAASFLHVDGRDLLIISNSGSSGSREVNSTVYEFTELGALEVLQYIATTGASDVATFQVPSGEWYAVICSREDSGGSPNVDSLVLRWNGERFEFFQSLATIGAAAIDVFSESSSIYLAFASFTDTRSPVYKWNNGQFRLLHNIDTQQASDMESVLLNGQIWLAVATGQSGVLLFVWSPDSETYISNGTLSSPSALRLESITGTDYLLVTNSGGQGQLFDLADQTDLGITLPMARHLYPFSLGNSSVYIAVALNTLPGSAELSSVGQLVQVSSSADYYPRSTVLTFVPGQRSHRVVVEVINDVTPEVDEQFSVQLTNAVGGAVIGSQQNLLSVTILTNDNAYGLIGFSESSLSVVAFETGISSAVALDVIREGGTFGDVSASWEVTGDHVEGEITPSSGEVVFAEGVFAVSLVIQVHPDVFPELNEVTVITFTEITQNGVSPGGDSTRGAQFITGQTQAVITVQANDAPHGVVVWSAAVVNATEQDGTDTTVQLTLLREFGAIGDIIITYSTFMDTNSPSEEQAIQGDDYLPTTSSVVMANGTTSATVPITILHDNIPELRELFLVSITVIQLINEEDRQGTVSSSPRTDPNRDTVTVRIEENDNSRGLLEFVVTEIAINETIGSALFVVRREIGTFGTVDVDFIVSGITATGGGVDFSPDSGSLQFAPDVSSQEVVINIINDSEAEFDESFSVSLVNVQDGATIGDRNSIIVTINRNDDINGVFSFDANSVLILIPESVGSADPLGLATLTMLRTRNFVGVVTVYWAVSEEGKMDIQPNSGNITFEENETERSFQVRAIDDGIPELFEAFSLSILSTEGGGRIGEPHDARIAIQASNDPNGVISFDSYPDGIIINEGDLLSFRIVRFSGLNGQVSATWEINPSDSTIFTSTSNTEVFADGQSEVVVTVQTISNDIPETARLFSVQILSTGVATVNESQSHIDVILTASDNPHGVVQFLQPSASETDEVAATVTIPIQRNYGLTGELMVNFSVSASTTATSPDDYTFQNQSVIIPANMGFSSILVTINDDEIPELAEVISLSLLSVELTQDINGGRDFDFAGDLSTIDMPPILGSVTQFTVTILENDDPYGIISFTSPTLVVTEGDSAVLSLERTGGTFGLVVLTVTVTAGAATTSDYNDITGTQVAFAQGQVLADVVIPTTQDDLPELQEDFLVSVALVSFSSPATLGTITSVAVIVDASDSPNGLLSFDNLEFSVGNPTVDDGPTELRLIVNRTKGIIGQTEVTWEVVGPYPGEEMNDISPTGDILVMQNGQGSGIIVLDILPSVGDEEEKSFTVNLMSASNNVEIDPQKQRVTITIAQRGMPYGVIGFFADVLQLQRVSETEQNQTLVLPIARSSPALGNVEVAFTITGDEDPSLDIYPSSGTIPFPSGLSQVDLSLTILADADPELEETFTVVLTQPTGGAQLNPLAIRSSFTIRANDAPYGRFTIENPYIAVSRNTPSIIERTLFYTIIRENGGIGDVMAVINTTYDPDPGAEYVEEFPTEFVEGARELEVSLLIASTAYLSADSKLTITISGLQLSIIEAQEGSGPEASSPVQVVVTDDVANPLIGFDSSSLEATIDDGTTEGSNVALTIVRRGRLGTVRVFWMAGAPNSMAANGSITPEEGSFLMGPNDTSTIINLMATPREPHGPQEVFAVYLSAQSVSPLTFLAQVNPLTEVSLFEPRGVVQLAGSTFSGVESTRSISVTVLRLYGSIGDIQVYGHSMTTPNSSVPANQEAAVQNVDFTASIVQTTIPDGSTSGVISVPVLDNQVSGPLKVFQFTLTSVTAADTTKSPRLSSSDLSALLTIIDDEAGAGLFRIQPKADTIMEESGRISFSIQRVGGSQGRVTVMVATIDGNPDSTGGLLATEGEDYTGLLPQAVVFEDGDTMTKTYEIPVTDDADPELAEQFTVTLSNPPGGTALIDPESDTLVVTIAASDNPGGVFSLSPSTLTLSEVSTPSGTIKVQRAGGTLTEVTIEWQALYTAGQSHNTSIASILGMEQATLTFPVGVTTANITLSLQADSVPASGEEFTLHIQSDDSGIDFAPRTEATITVLPRDFSVFQFVANDRLMVSTVAGSLALSVERVEGLQLSSAVHYSTIELSRPITIGQLSFDAALFGVHFTDVSGSLTFSRTNAKKDISLNIISVDVRQPVAFNISITVSHPNQVRNSMATVVISPPGAKSSLISLYFDATESTTTAELESITNHLYNLLSVGTQVGGTTVFVNGEDQIQSDTTRYIINTVTTKASTRYTNSLRGNMSDIFQRVIDDSTFSQRSQFIQSMQLLAYSLLEGQPCNLTSPVTIVLSRLLFYLEAVRIPPSDLLHHRFSAFSASGSDFVRFPGHSIFAGNTLTGLECVDVHYIEVFDEGLLLEPTLNSKVLSVGIEGQSTQTQSPITYRIHSGTSVMPSERDCLLWNRTSRSWNDNICSTKLSLVLQQDYVECECYSLGEFAVTNDVERGYGWTVPAGAVAALNTIVLILVIVVHMRYFRRTQLATRVFLMLCVATLLFQMMIMVAVFASNRSGTTESGCSAIAIVLHFTAILQFVWVLAMAASLWLNFMGMTDGKEPLIIYVIICWVIAIFWTISTVLIGRFALEFEDMNFSDVYGLVGDFCFMPELSVSLIATVLPTVFVILSTVAFLSHSCVYWSRWEDFHNMYLDSFNKTEIPLLVMFFVMVFLSSLTAYIHFYVREVYTFSIFVTIEFIQAVYILIVYVFISWHTLARKHKKYGIEDEVEPLTVPGEPDYMGSFSTLASSMQRLDMNREERTEQGEDEDDEESVSDIGRPVVGLAMKQFPSVEQSVEGEESQLDDLMFMLKTQNYPQDEETQPLFPESLQKPSVSEHMELRRISIADTHL